MKRTLFITLLTGIMFTSFGQKINKDLPSIKLKTLDNKTIDLKEMVKPERTTVIIFWATWCSPCKKELENVDEMLDDWKKKYPVDLIAISIDDSRNSGKVKPYIDGKGYKFPVLLDINQDTKPVFNYPTVPFSAIIDKNKKIVYIHNGYVEGDEYNLEKQIKEICGK